MTIDFEPPNQVLHWYYLNEDYNVSGFPSLVEAIADRLETEEGGGYSVAIEDENGVVPQARIDGLMGDAYAEVARQTAELIDWSNRYSYRIEAQIPTIQGDEGDWVDLGRASSFIEAHEKLAVISKRIPGRVRVIDLRETAPE
jgi:hypothetical protein